MKVEIVPISKVKPNPENPRTIKDEKFLKLVESIKAFPKMLEIRPIVVNDDMIILGGNMRLKACIEAGFKKIHIIKASNLTADQQKEFIIKDNLSFGDWDWEMLLANFDPKFLEDWGMDIPVFKENTSTEDDNFELPEEVKTKLKLGDLIEIGSHRLICGDSQKPETYKKLMNGKKADIVFTSPPYNANTSFQNTKNKGKLYENYDDNMPSDKYVKFTSTVLDQCFKNTKGYIFWNVNYNSNSKSEFIKQIIGKLDFLEETICWKKTALPVAYGLTRTWEPIFVFRTDKTSSKRIGEKFVTEFNYWEITNIGTLDKNHRAAFPIKLVEKAINLCDPKIILEPFCGTGTAMVAAEQLGKSCYSSELDPKYCQVIIDRMLKLNNQLRVKINGVKYTKSNT